MKTKYLAEAVSVYKILGSIFRIVIGAIILYSGFNLERIIAIVHRSRLQESTKSLFTIFLEHIKPDVSLILVYALVVSLIAISTLEIIFAISLLARKRIGGIGLFVTSILWIPVEILFVSKFILTSRLVILIINLLIVYSLYRILSRPGGYFKKE